jgi:hypothetical protein
LLGIEIKICDGEVRLVQSFLRLYRPLLFGRKKGGKESHSAFERLLEYNGNQEGKA